MKSAKFKHIVIRFITKKVFVASLLLTLSFVAFNVHNYLTNLNISDPNKQKFFRAFIFSVLIYLFLLTSLLLLKLIVERIRNIPGSKLRFKLTIIIALVSFIPALLLTISSSFLINEAMNRAAPKMNIIKPLEKSLNFYRENIHAEFKKLFQKPLNILKNTPKFNLSIRFKTINLNGLDFAQVFQMKNNNMQIFGTYNKAKLNTEQINFYQEYFSQEEFTESYIHKIDDKRWIIFIIKLLDKRENIYFVIGKILGKKKLAVAEGINAILERYKSLKIISYSLQTDFQLFILLISLPVILLAIILGFSFARTITKPLDNLVAGTKKIARGVYGYQIDERASDELGMLIEAFNSMSNDLYMNKNKLFEAEKMAAWSEVAKKLAHEVKNPLTPIKLAAERLLRSYRKNPDKFEGVLTSCSNTISSEVDRLKDLVNEFSKFARFPLTKLREENIVGLTEEIVSIYKDSSPNISFNFKNHLGQKEYYVKIDKNQIKQVTINLIENAIEAVKEEIAEPEISINITLITKTDGRYFQLSIKDNGKGIPKKYQENIFDPYFSTKKRGSGLGLSIVKNIIEEHKGIIYFITKDNEGTTFFIEIPVSWRVNE